MMNTMSMVGQKQCKRQAYYNKLTKEIRCLLQTSTSVSTEPVRFDRLNFEVSLEKLDLQ